MRVFVAGATGAIGRPLLRALAAAGHEVTGMTRSGAKTELLRELGAEPVVCDALDAEALRAAVVDARPDVVVHELTDIPPAIDPRRIGEQFAGTNRLRTEGTRNLVEAARAAGAGRLIAQSIAFVYEPTGTGLKVESDPLHLDAPEPARTLVRAVDGLEHTVTGAEGIDGLVLRYGYLYGPGTAYAADGSTADAVRHGKFPIVGRGTGVFSFVHVEDAARATGLAVERGAPGIYNVVDDDPAPVAAWLPAYAAALGAPAPRRVPKLLARLAAGSYAVSTMTETRGASNARARRELGWEPLYPSWRDGFRELAG